MDPDLFVAILAMDAYNRNNPGSPTTEFNLSGSLTTTQIGSATVDNVALPLGWQAAGFYAVAYNWNGTTVISYRGTNEQQVINPITGQPTGGYIPVANDLLNGWSLFDGIGTNSQAALAAQFYSSVFPATGGVTV